MCNNRIAILFLITSTLLGFNASAQSYPVSAYSFSQFAGTYSAVTGGTVFGNASSDDQDFVSLGGGTLGITAPSIGTGIPIGFNFNFAGTVYDRFGINNNGYIFLGQSALGSAAVNSDRGINHLPNYFPLNYTISSAPVILQNMICGFGNDLLQTANNSLRARLLGTTPNQTLVVQFNNFDIYNGSGGGGSSITFQIRLYETSNTIDVIYGTFSNLVDGPAQVGLRGTAAFYDFNMRDVNYNTSATSWSNSAIAPNINSALSYTTFAPSNGQIYRWTPPPPCSGAPASNTIVTTSTIVCPGYGVSTMSLANSYSVSGISYQWQSSTASSSGPFSSISNATLLTLVTPTANQTTWYQLTASCSSGGTTTMSPVQLQIAATTTNSVPYFEGFDGVNSSVNELPNCSWFRTSPSITTATNSTAPLSGVGYVIYDATNCISNVSSYLYSNGIQLYPGVTYSASIWYAKANSLQDIGLLFGTSQSSIGLTSISNINNPPYLSGNVYAPLTNTFQVSSPGLYYIAIKITNNCYGGIRFEDLAITIPCTQASGNAPTLLVTGPSTICEGQSANLVASGANSYFWSTGATTASISETPVNIGTYSVTGTNTLSGCSSTAVNQVSVNPLPIVSISTNTNSVCSGSSASLLASGALSYTWSNGANTASISLTPSTTTNYTVYGAGSFGCIGSASLLITVIPSPTITVVGNTLICAGGVTYQWSSNSFSSQATTINPAPLSTSLFTVASTAANGCVGIYTFPLSIDPCLGINSNNTRVNNVSVYPNPNNGEFTIELKNDLAKTIELMDVTGKVVLSATTNDDVIRLNINHLSNGMYHIKIKSNNAVDVLKVVKQ
jgi:hypothetical protein